MWALRRRRNSSDILIARKKKMEWTFFGHNNLSLRFVGDIERTQRSISVSPSSSFLEETPLLVVSGVGSFVRNAHFEWRGGNCRKWKIELFFFECWKGYHQMQYFYASVAVSATAPSYIVAVKNKFVNCHHSPSAPCLPRGAAAPASPSSPGRWRSSPWTRCAPERSPPALSGWCRSQGRSPRTWSRSPGKMDKRVF